ncbi:MAG: PQQ-binding-like beta-propeller repeat protein, partial [Sandaracinaceae bacterium]|nr:PQQ-binding-like beta-propeller repeat protein [Sandaracinaceae bacterium]
MSDSECRGNRICHQGRCLFEEEARAAMQAQLHPPDPTERPDAGATPPAPEGERPMFMGGPRRTGRSAANGPASAPSVAWTFRTEARVFASPVVGPDGTIYVGSLDRTFAAIAPDGRLRWRFVGGEKFYSSAAIGADGTIYVGCHDG